MSSYIIIITIVGLAALGMAWMPAIVKKTKISYSIIYVILGILIYRILGNLLPLPDPISKNEYTVRITELVVIVSLMGTGLKIDQPFSLRNWAIPLRLVSITMVLSIALIAVIAHWAFAFDWASAILLGAVLAPTDPVLASDVQVGPPMEGIKDNVKFSLTAEAGMNDGTAFPFTWLAILLSVNGTGGSVLSEWFWVYLLYKIAAGAIAGFIIGKCIAFLVFKLPERSGFLFTQDGFVAISATLVAYGITEMIHGYGFIAVFATAVTIRNHELHHKYHKRLHEFTDQIERILVAIVLLLFGGSLVSGILNALNWKMIAFGIGFVLLIRPLTSIAGMIGKRLHLKEKLGIGFFGIKGMGSFYYLAFALSESYFPLGEELWAIVAFIVLLSIILHGLTATSVMKKLDKEFGQEREKPGKPQMNVSGQS